MTCQSCADAVKHPTSDQFTAGCDSCQARALAATGGHLLPPVHYTNTMRKLFGDKWQEMVPEVERWASRIRQARAQVKA